MHSITLTDLESDARKYWPMRIADCENQAGCRLGGFPPLGIVPAHANDETHYFGTFLIGGEPLEEVSIFTSFKYIGTDDPRCINNHTHKLIKPSSEVIQCLFHGESKRAKRGRWKAELEGYSVEFGEEALDEKDDELHGVPHKTGGLTFLYPKDLLLKQSLDDLIGSGYVHFLQWAFPGPKDCNVKGMWPFGDYFFNLYIKRTGSSYTYQGLLV